MLVTMLVIVYSYEIFVCNVMCMLVPRFVLGQFECMTEHRPWSGAMSSQKADPIFLGKWRKKNITCVSILTVGSGTKAQCFCPPYLKT